MFHIVNIKGNQLSLLDLSLRSRNWPMYMPNHVHTQPYKSTPSSIKKKIFSTIEIIIIAVISTGLAGYILYRMGWGMKCRSCGFVQIQS